MTTKQQKNTVKELVNELKQCQISTSPIQNQDSDIIFNENIDQNLLSQWPKLKYKVPIIFLHNPADFQQYLKKVINMGIKFYYQYIGRYYTKIKCETLNDHKLLTQYFNKNQLPYHTFGNPNQRKLKVVMRGLPTGTKLDRLKSVLKSASIPVIRVHQMKTKKYRIDCGILILVVLQYGDDQKIFRIQKLLGKDIKMEPPISKTKQCYRCQKWGHSQRYCHGQIKCVKCAGDHLSKKCERDPEKEPPKCANCCGEHTANYRLCSYCPDSPQHKKTQALKHRSRTEKFVG